MAAGTDPVDGENAAANGSRIFVKRNVADRNGQSSSIEIMEKVQKDFLGQAAALCVSLVMLYFFMR